MTIRSTLGAWALVLLAIPIAVCWSGTWLTLLDWWRNVARTIGAPRAIVLLIVIGNSGAVARAQEADDVVLVIIKEVAVASGFLLSRS